MRRLFMIGLAALTAAGTALRAAEVADPAPRLYTLEQCIRLALDQSGRSLNARRDQAIAETKATQARSEALPQLSLNASYTRLDTVQEMAVGDQTAEMGSLDNYSTTASLNQLLYSGGRVGAALRAAGLAKTHAEWSRRETEAAIVRDVRVGFYDVLLARSAVSVSEESAAQLEALVKQTRDKKQRGLASEFDLLTADVKLANEKPRLIRARGNLTLALESFRRMLGLDDADYGVEGRLEYREQKAETRPMEEMAQARRPALRVMEALVKLSREDVIATRSKGQPNVSAFASYNGANAYRFASFKDDWEWHWSAGLVANWNIWDGNLTRGAVREKELTLEKAETDLDELRKAIRLEVRQCCIDLAYAREAVEASRGTVGMAKKALSIARTRHEQGLATYLEFTDANVGLSAARLAELSAMADHLKAAARLRYATGAGEDQPVIREENKP